VRRARARRALSRRTGDFAAAEHAVQKALPAAALVAARLLLPWATVIAGRALRDARLPLAGLDPPPLPLPGSPDPLVRAAAGVVIFLVPALVAFPSGRRTLRLIR
jgi:putative ABC transport system permease protein